MGISIRTNQVFAPGTQVTIGLDPDGSILTARGTVRWAKRVPSSLVRHTRCGMGIQFTSLSRKFREFLMVLDKRGQRS